MVKELTFIVSVVASHSPTAVWRKVGEEHVETKHPVRKVIAVVQAILA